jgi:hypothetical protein
MTQERLYCALLRLYPAAFRARFGDEMVQLFADQLRDTRARDAPTGIARMWLRTLGDLATTAANERLRGDRSVAHSLATPPSTSSRVLGLAGILAGAILIVPGFLPALVPFEMTPELFNARLVVYNAGAIAILVGVHQRQVSRAPLLAWLAAVPAVLANAWYLALIVRVVGQPGPGVGPYEPAFLPAGIALWLTDAWFGAVALRLGVVTRVGALVLAIGSALTITGIAQLGLTTPEAPTIFQPIALTGIALNGFGWVALGIDLATRRRSADPRPGRASPAD